MYQQVAIIFTFSLNGILLQLYVGEALKNKNSTLSQDTVETGNKRRPVLIKRGSQKFEALPPEPPDPNSGNEHANSLHSTFIQKNILFLS